MTSPYSSFVGFDLNLVKQTRKIYENGGENWQDAVLPIITQIQENSNSHGLLLRVASYPDDVFRETERVISVWESSRPMEEMPQKIFKSLAGLSDDTILGYLRKIECAADIPKTSKVIETRKRMEVLQGIVVQRTGSSTWEEACDKFDDLAEKLESFKGLNITRKFIPKVFLDFIDDLKEQRDIGVIDLEIHVDNEFKDHPSIVKIINEQKKILRGKIVNAVRKIREE